MKAKLINLLKMYLTPPREDGDGVQSSRRSSARNSSPPATTLPHTDPPPLDEDEIYKNVEFRHIVTDCISLLKDGRAIMEELYSSVTDENGTSMSADF